MRAAFRFVLAVALSLAPVAAQRKDWPDYKTVKFSEAWASATFAKPTNDGKPVYSFESAAQQHKFIVTATYTGKLRKILPLRLELISRWGKSFDAQDFTAHFDQEAEVQADGLTAWLPLQDVLVEYFSREVKVGQAVELWMMYIGAVQAVNAPQPERIFLVNEFQAVNR